MDKRFAMPFRPRILIIASGLILAHLLYSVHAPGTSVCTGGVLAGVILLDLIAAKVLMFSIFPAIARNRRFLRGVNTLARIIHVACVCLILVSAWRLLALWMGHIEDTIAYPLPLNSMEGRETVKAWLLAHGNNIYSSLKGPPFLVTIYPPLYHVAVAVVAPFLGWTLKAGRCISLGCFLGLAALTGLITRRSTGTWLAALAVTCMFLFTPVAKEWSLQARPDMLAWFLALAGMWCFSEACSSPPSYRRVELLAVAAGVLLCMAVFTKQQALPYFLGCLAWGAGKRSWRQSAMTAAAFVLLGLALFGVLQMVSGGGFMRDCIIYPAAMGGNTDINTLGSLMQRLGAIWDQLQVWILLLLAYFLWATWQRRWDLSMVLVLVNAVFMVKLLASWGADLNYVIGTLVAAALCVGTLFGALVRFTPLGPPLALIVLLAWLPAPATPAPTETADLSWVRAISGSVLVTTEGGQAFLGIADGQRTTFFDGIETQLYEETGMWTTEGSRLVEDIREKRFDHLVLYGDFSPRAFRDAVALYYDLEASHGNYKVFRPGMAAMTAELDSTGAWRVKGAWRVAEADVTSLHRETEGLAPVDRSRPGYARFKLVALAPLKKAEARFAVRLDPKAAGAAASWTLRDFRGRVLAYGAASRSGHSDVVVETAKAGTDLELLVELEGNAWIEAVNGDVAVLRGFD